MSTPSDRPTSSRRSQKLKLKLPKPELLGSSNRQPAFVSECQRHGVAPMLMSTTSVIQEGDEHDGDCLREIHESYHIDAVAGASNRIKDLDKQIKVLSRRVPKPERLPLHTIFDDTSSSSSSSCSRSSSSSARAVSRSPASDTQRYSKNMSKNYESNIASNVVDYSIAHGFTTLDDSTNPLVAHVARDDRRNELTVNNMSATPINTQVVAGNVDAIEQRADDCNDAATSICSMNLDDLDRRDAPSVCQPPSTPPSTFAPHHHFENEFDVHTICASRSNEYPQQNQQQLNPQDVFALDKRFERIDRNGASGGSYFHTPSTRSAGSSFCRPYSSAFTTPHSFFE